MLLLANEINRHLKIFKGLGQSTAQAITGQIPTASPATEEEKEKLQGSPATQAAASAPTTSTAVVKKAFRASPPTGEEAEEPQQGGVDEKAVAISDGTYYQVPTVTSHWYGKTISMQQKKINNDDQKEIDDFIGELQKICMELDEMINTYDGVSSTMLTLTASVGAIALIIQTAITTTNLVSNTSAFQAAVTATGSALVGGLKLGGSFFANCRDKAMTYKGDVLDLLNQVKPVKPK